jgi:hypothetical protein
MSPISQQKRGVNYLESSLVGEIYFEKNMTLIMTINKLLWYDAY